MATMQSMTGFARMSGGDASASWTWEIRSVNARGLDIRLRIPSGLESIEPDIRAAAGDRLKRGNLSATLTLTRTEATTRVQVNRELLEELLKLVREIAGADRPVDIETLLNVRGVVEVSEPEDADETLRQRGVAVRATFRGALDDLIKARLTEGKKLVPVLREHLRSLTSQIEAAEAVAAAQSAVFARRLGEQVAELLGSTSSVAEDRIAQEVALLATKADVREELDRLKAHVAAAGELIEEGLAVGRRLDFLCQELNREANTVCSKASDLELTRIGLEMKASVERLREQVQNVE